MWSPGKNMVMMLKQFGEFFAEFIFDFVKFPWWWYSGGLVSLLSWCGQSWRETRQRIGLGFFVRYFFQPMYQDYSIQGRLISLVMRTILTIVKLVRFVLAGLYYVVIILGWLLLLPVCLLMIFSDI